MIYTTPRNMRTAFSMITALFVIVIMATVAGFIMSLSGKMIQETSTQYKKEQAILYAKSYTEYAIMAATTKTCVKRITAFVDGSTLASTNSGDGYRIIIDVQYVGNNAGCIANSINLGTTPIVDPSSKGAFILIDTYVKYRDTDTSAAFGSATTVPWVTYHRRTLQRL